MPPNAFHGPLPFLVPQPLKTSMMIKKRIKDKQRRLDEYRLLLAWRQDQQTELLFESLLARENVDFRVSEDLHSAGWFL